MWLQLLCTIGIVGGLAAPQAAVQQDGLRRQAAAAMRKAVRFFSSEVAKHGGYLWRYSADLARREGEGRATASTGWVQPPGTPSVGGAYLAAYVRTGEPYLLEAARQAAYALVRTQLRSGGWDYRIEFDPKRRSRYAYRVEPPAPKQRNTTTLDDNNTQEAVRFLMRVDKTLHFKDPRIHEAVQYALDCLLKAQYPNGAWPQRFDHFPDPARFPVKKASYPQSWSRAWPKRAYGWCYTFNDNAIPDVIDVMLEAADTYDEPRYREAAEKGGQFILLAQMPQPQPGWAQQYDADMHPAWARKFEPPAITGGEARGVIRTLIKLYRRTGNDKYLKPIPPALEYYRRSALPDGRLARFYELKTNKPLYFTKDYRLTYSDADMPTHYAFKVGNWVEAIAREYQQVLRTGPQGAKRSQGAVKPRLTPALAARTKAIVDALDQRGAWVEPGRLRYHGSQDPTRQVIDCRTFIKNLDTLSAYLAASAR